MKYTKIAKDGILRSSNEILTQKGVDMHKIREIWSHIPYYDNEIDEQIEINAHYRGYLKKQKADILAFKRDENLLIPEKISDRKKLLSQSWLEPMSYKQFSNLLAGKNKIYDMLKERNGTTDLLKKKYIFLKYC